MAKRKPDLKIHRPEEKQPFRSDGNGDVVSVPGNVFDAPGITDEPAASAAYHLAELVIPLAEEAPGYQPMLVELRLRRDQAITVRRLLEGLAAAGAKRGNGQPPKKYEDGLLILIDMLGTAASVTVSPPPHESPAEYQGG